jgi:hypothetical protein
MPRLATSLTLLLPDGWKAAVMDLSATGMRVRTLAVVPTGTELGAQLQLEDGTLVPVRFAVVWTARPEEAGPEENELGLEMLDVSQAYLDAVALLFAEAR